MSISIKIKRKSPNSVIGRILMEWASGLHEIKAPNSGSRVRESDLAAEKADGT